MDSISSGPDELVLALASSKRFDNLNWETTSPYIDGSQRERSVVCKFKEDSPANIISGDSMKDWEVVKLEIAESLPVASMSDTVSSAGLTISVLENLLISFVILIS